MPEHKIKRALIAVYDKTGIAEFARALVDKFGIEIISTGGTAKHLKEHGIPVTMVEEVTGFPEMLDGRVKTLHPKIHAGILADRDNPDHMRQLAEHGIKPIDMVVVNLYPFEKTVADPNCKFEDAIEMIDIGGPCMLRAAAKNFRHVWPICDSRLCSEFLAMMREPDPAIRFTPEEKVGTRRTFASITFKTTSLYDASIQCYFIQKLVGETSELFGAPSERFLPNALGLGVHRVAPCRYGENPHQSAAAYAPPTVNNPTDEPSVLRGGYRGVTSFNNLVDAESALALCVELTRAGGKPNKAVFIKHTNACGVGIADDCKEAYRRAYMGDPNAAMGGILSVNFAVNADFAATVMETYDRFGKAAGAGGFFVEVLVAPSFDDEAVEVIRGKKPGVPVKKWGENVRLLAVGDMSLAPDPNELEYKSIAGGMLVQTRDLVGLNEDQWKVVTKRAPTDSEMSDLRLAWLIAKHTKSNAISLCKDGMLIGNGAGQMSRVMSCRIATWLARENGHADRLKGSVAASDAFFPFADGPNILMETGVSAIIQPGGSKRDEETIKACDERGVAMIFTGTRHFKH